MGAQNLALTKYLLMEDMLTPTPLMGEYLRLTKNLLTKYLTPVCCSAKNLLTANLLVKNLFTKNLLLTENLLAQNLALTKYLLMENMLMPTPLLTENLRLTKNLLMKYLTPVCCSGPATASTGALLRSRDSEILCLWSLCGLGTACMKEWSESASLLSPMTGRLGTG